MSYEHNVGPPARGDLRRARKKGLIRRLIRQYFSWFARLREASLWSRGYSLPPGPAREFAEARFSQALGLEGDEPENPSGLPQAELTGEQEHEAQQEYQRKHPTRDGD